MIVMLHQGAVVEVGTHDDPMAHRGPYYALYRQQENADEDESAKSDNVGEAGLQQSGRDVPQLSSSFRSAPQDATHVETYDESILQQGRFWMRTVTWTIGTTVFGVGWLAWHRPRRSCGPWSAGADRLRARHSDACGWWPIRSSSRKGIRLARC